MAGFYIYETKPLKILLKRNGEKAEGILEDYKKIIVTIKQDGTVIEKTGNSVEADVEESTVSIYLSQQETAIFKPGSAQIQVNVLFEDTERDTSSQGIIHIMDNLHKEVMT